MTTRRPTSRCAAALILLVLTAGCAGEDEPADTTPSTPSGTASASPGVGGTAAPSESPTSTTEPTTAPTTEPTDEPTSEPTTSSEPPPDPATVGPTTYGEALALVSVSSQREELSRFASPTGNLYCVLDSPVIPPSCELGRGAIPDPTVCSADGPSQSVGRVELTEAAPQPVCNSDTIREPGAPTLGYGAVATWPGVPVTCLMEEVGVTCVDTDREQGFFLARDRYQVF